MISLKRSGGSTTGFRISQPHTPAQRHNAAPSGSAPPYAAMGFIARTADGQLMRLNAIAGFTTQITYKRRRIAAIA